MIIKKGIHINELVNNLACFWLSITCTTKLMLCSQQFRITFGTIIILSLIHIHMYLKLFFLKQEESCKYKNTFYTSNNSKCKYLIKHCKTSKREPIPRKAFIPSQINVCINVQTIYIQPVLHGCGNKALYVTSFSFRQFKKIDRFG